MKKLSVSMDRERFSRVNTKLTREALLRLNQECKARETADLWGRSCPQGCVLTELILRHLPPLPESAGEPPKPPAKAKRGNAKEPIAMTA
jgi:hypothetical protein